EQRGRLRPVNEVPIVQIVSLAETRKKSITNPNYGVVMSSYYGEAGAVCGGPQGFLAGIGKGGAMGTPPFHDVDQYQVFVRGGGRLGRTPADPVTFHYADAYTPYGPIVGGGEGIDFLTIRAACATGYFPMPGSRHHMPGKAGRTLAGKF